MGEISNRDQKTIGIQLEANEFPVIPGSTSTISFTLRNLSSKQDYFEISLLGIPVAWITIPTPVIFLSPGEQTTVALSVLAPSTPQAAAGWYPLKILITSQRDRSQASEAEIALKVAVYELQGRIGVLMHSNQFTVTPGSSVTIPIVLRNQGLEPDNFRVGVDGIPTGWVSTTSPTTLLEPGEQKGLTLTIRPERNPQSRAGRHHFSIQVFSQKYPDEVTRVECALTIAVYTQYAAQLEPENIRAGQPAHLIIANQGNIQQTYSISWASHQNILAFTQKNPEPIRVSAGESVYLEFTADTRRPPFFGQNVSYPFTATIHSAEGESVTASGSVTKQALLPMWAIPVIAVICLGLTCISALWLYNRGNAPNPSATQTAQAVISEIAGATQTAAFNQTAAAISGQQDSDGDGLTNQREAELGTDPTNPDTDGDGLWDGDEVLKQGTDPKNTDTDADGLSDGDEILNRGTDARNPDSDGDQLKDGEEVRLGLDPKKADTDADGLSDSDEIQRGTTPTNPDSDGDGLKDGDEVILGTNPVNPDTDNDRLVDGRESADCPNYFNPDTDSDGIIDGLDIDPCNPQNPSLTATVNASITNVPSTAAPSLVPTVPATVAPSPTPTTAITPPALQGSIVFESNRDGNSEIYMGNLANGSINRLTNNLGADIQPALSPDGNRVVFTSNRNGNNEIYIMNVDGSNQTNLTNNQADDQFPDWSPDGNWIAFTTTRDGNQEIYVVRSDGSELRNVSNNSANDFQPTWFKFQSLLISEEWIVFTSDRNGNQEIYTVRPNGQEPINISLNPAEDNEPQGNADGVIVFSSSRDGNMDVYSINLDGTGVRRLTTNPAKDQWPTWSPDMDWVAFTTDRDGNPEIYTMRANGADAVNYTLNPSTDTHPSWR